MTERELTDDDVEEALSALILRMREGPLPPLEERNMVTLTGEDEDETELIVWNVRRNWQILAERHPLPRRDDLIGILRTILHSLGIWRSKSMSSQGYLRYIEGFMKETGVNIRQVTEDLEPVPEPEDDPLLVLGRAWIQGREPAAAGEFAEEVESLLGLGAAERVLNVCQQLIGESRDKSVLPLLQAFAIRGHHAIRTEMG